MAKRMLKKSSSAVVASLNSSTYRGVHLAISLAAALLGGLFEHPPNYDYFLTHPPGPSTKFPGLVF